MSSLTSDSPQSNCSVLLPTSLRDALVALAKKNQRTLSGEMRFALERHVEEHA